MKEIKWEFYEDETDEKIEINNFSDFNLNDIILVKGSKFSYETVVCYIGSNYIRLLRDGIKSMLRYDDFYYNRGNDVKFYKY